MKSKKYRVFLSGGGTLGSVTPLIALREAFLDRGFAKHDFLFVGTRDGVERSFVSDGYGIEYEWIHAGKLRRYLSFKNLIDLFFIFLGFIDSCRLIFRYRPEFIVSAGGFCALPLSIIGRLFRVRVYIHQLDIKVGLANKILAPFANRITVTFKESLFEFDEKKAFHVGTPVRNELFVNNNRFIKEINKSLPTVIVLGGGLGSKAINELVYASLSELLRFCNVIHLTGRDKSLKDYRIESGENVGRYCQYEFIERGLASLFHMADLVVTRAGMGTLSELIALDKKMIIIPIPMTQQQENADYFAKRLGICVMDQDSEFSIFVKHVRELLSQKNQISYSKSLGVDFRESANQWASLIVSDQK